MPHAARGNAPGADEMSLGREEGRFVATLEDAYEAMYRRGAGGTSAG